MRDVFLDPFNGDVVQCNSRTWGYGYEWTVIAHSALEVVLCNKGRFKVCGVNEFELMGQRDWAVVLRIDEEHYRNKMARGEQ